MTNYKLCAKGASASGGQITNENKLLAAAAYAFFIPSLYIALTDKRKQKFLAFAAAQSIILWIVYILIFIVLRILLNLIWTISYFPILNQIVLFIKLTMWGYALFLASKAIKGESHPIPYLSNLADKIC